MTSCTGGVATYETTFEVLAHVESEDDVNDALSGINHQDLYTKIFHIFVTKFCNDNHEILKVFMTKSRLSSTLYNILLASNQ